MEFGDNCVGMRRIALKTFDVRLQETRISISRLELAPHENTIDNRWRKISLPENSWVRLHHIESGDRDLWTLVRRFAQAPRRQGF